MLAWLVAAFLSGVALVAVPAWQVAPRFDDVSPMPFDDVMAVSNAAHLVRTGRPSETFFRSRIRPAITVALLPPAFFERGLTRIDTRSPSDGHVRDWHIYRGRFRVTTAWVVILSASMTALAPRLLPAAVRGAAVLGWVAAPLAAGLFARQLVQPITQGIGWSLALGLGIIAAREFARSGPPRWWILAALFATGILAGQDVAPVLAAVGMTAGAEHLRRAGLRAALVSLAAAVTLAVAIVTGYFVVVLRSSPVELVDFVFRDVPFSHALMGYARNTLGGSARDAAFVLAWIGAPLALVACLVVLRAAGGDWRAHFLAIWLAAGFALPAMLPFVFPRFFTGLIVPAVLLIVWAARIGRVGSRPTTPAGAAPG